MIPSVLGIWGSSQSMFKLDFLGAMSFRSVLATSACGLDLQRPAIVTRVDPASTTEFWSEAEEEFLNPWSSTKSIAYLLDAILLQVVLYVIWHKKSAL
jgi:hypothetical protein